MGRGFKGKIFRFTGIGVLLVLFVFAQVRGRETVGNSGNDIEVQENTAENENMHEYFLPEGYTEIPQMDEEENGVHITGAVLVHDGMPYALTKEEYLFLHSGMEDLQDALIEELLAKRKGNGGK